jgi:putative ABC transport system permease protein
MSLIDSVKQSVISSLESLGGDVVFIQKFPWTFEQGQEYPWWKYVNRPNTSLIEFKKLEENCTLAEKIAYEADVSMSVSYLENKIEETSIGFISHDYNVLQNLNVEKGRYFSQMESNYGHNVALIGNMVAVDLFKKESPLEKYIKIGNKKVLIIGVLEKVGQSMTSNYDHLILLPLNYGKTIFNVEKCNPTILVSVKKGYSIENLSEELTVLMRGLRRLSPYDEDNFALNKASMIMKSMESIFQMLNVVGIFVGGFAMLVGGFGIANIMFVSVKERTKQIGIQKAIGAKSYIILFQFLSESVILCLIGGIVGLILVSILMHISTLFLPFKFSLSFFNIIIGIVVSVAIGLISGFAPARKAAKLNPIDAINYI